MLAFRKLFLVFALGFGIGLCWVASLVLAFALGAIYS